MNWDRSTYFILISLPVKIKFRSYTLDPYGQMIVSTRLFTTFVISHLLGILLVNFGTDLTIVKGTLFEGKTYIRR